MKTLKQVHYAFFVLLFSMLVLQACESMGGSYENVDTSRKAILVAAAEVRGANFLLQDLADKRVIDNASATRALTSLRTASANLRTALNAVDNNGDPKTVETGMERARVSINIALELLANFAGEPL